jgi:hypothetical protein
MDILSENISRLLADNLLPLADEVPTLSEPDDSVHHHPRPPEHLSQFVEHVPKLDISTGLSSAIEEELKSFQLRTRSSKNKRAKVKTRWLCPSDDPYVYGSIVNSPLPIGNYPNILKLMDIVNSDSSTSGDMDSCLVSCYSTHKTSLSLHRDDESLMSQSSSICTVSFGAPRVLEFVQNDTAGRKGGSHTADLTLPATHHSMNVMKPGCQAALKHRVPPQDNPTGPGLRYSLSFRKLAHPTEDSTDPIASPNLANVSSTTPTRASQPSSPSQQDLPKPKTPITLLAGDSFFERLDSERLAKGKRRVYNIAKGGSKMITVSDSILKFTQNHPDLFVQKLFLSVGTNDIRNCSQGIRHLKGPLCDLLKTVKQALPETKVFIQSLIPIPTNGCSYTSANVVDMNAMIFNMCSRYKVYFINVFNAFLDCYGSTNLDLFPGYNATKGFYDIHPNAKGKGVLARFYIYLIHSRWFNPLGY